MYDRPETAPVYDRLWQGVRARLGAGPMALDRGEDPWAHWLSPRLLISQTCGLPFRSRLRGKVTLIGTPDPGLPGLLPGQYQSVIVVRRDDPAHVFADLAGAPFAYNEALSQSGWAAPHALALAEGVRFGPLLRTGAHEASARAVAAGRARAAALDRLSWQLMERFDPFTGALRVLCMTPPTPALPLITASGRDPAPIRVALSSALRDIPPADRALIGAQRLVAIPNAAYFAHALPPAPPESA